MTDDGQLDYDRGLGSESRGRKVEFESEDAKKHFEKEAK
jgi:hypothetical protein